MTALSAKLGVSNQTKQPRIVWVEPWAEDFTLLPGEELEIVCRGDTEQPWFCVVENQDSTQVYVESGGYPDVLQNGQRLKCGYNRQAAKDAGLPL
jgi:hypothetical protein